MSTFRRIFFFLLVNIAVIATISIITSVFNIQPYLDANGINYSSLLIFCLLWGMGGSFISLLMSKWIAKKMMRVQIITNEQGELGELKNLVHRLARQANLPKMPEVGIYESDEVNAFATGATKSNSLVAVSSGLLRSMSPAEVEGVLAHEVSHIANGDMVTMTLIQGIINAFVMFLSRVIAFAVARDGDGKRSHGIEFMLVIVLDILFSILGSIVVNYFSRWREFRADAGAARLAGREKMIAALKRLQSNVAMVDNSEKAFNSMKISGGRPSFAALFSTHPSLQDRITRLERGQY